MTPAEYLAALDQLGLSGQQAAAFLGVNRATAWRWRTDGPPAAVAKLLAVMVARKLSVAKVDDLQLTVRRSLLRARRQKPID